MGTLVLVSLLSVSTTAQWATVPKTVPAAVSVPMVLRHGDRVPVLMVLPTFNCSVVEKDSPVTCPGSDYDNSSEDSSDTNYYGPLVPCNFLDERWVDCNDPVDVLPLHGSNRTKVPGTCLKFGGTDYHLIEKTNVCCQVLPYIECRGERSFYRQVPCIKYTGHYFLSTLLYSIFLGMLAVDRFCLGYSAIAVGKLMTLGGLGVWWIIDIFYIVTGKLMPADGSNWQPYF